MNTILLLNGPNLGLLGIRQPEIYGTTTLDDIRTKLEARCKSANHRLESLQSDHEGELVAKLGAVYRSVVGKKVNLSGIIINPAGLTHTSVALRDALEIYRNDSTGIVEVHLSNIYQREDFRKQSLTAAAANAVITGLGAFGYEAALEFLLKRQEKN